MEDPTPLFRVQVRPGDRLVVRTDQYLNAEHHRSIRNQVAAKMGVPFEDVLLLDGGVQLDVVSAEDQRRVPDLLAANTRTWNRNVALSALLHECGEQFRFYEAQHRAKGTPEADAKAEVNGVLAARIAVALKMNASPVVEPVGKVGAGDGDTEYGREVWPHQDRAVPLYKPDPFVFGVDDVKAAAPVVQGGDRLVDAFLNAKAVSGDLFRTPQALLRDFVAFAGQQLRARVTSSACAMDVVADTRRAVCGW